MGLTYMCMWACGLHHTVVHIRHIPPLDHPSNPILLQCRLSNKVEAQDVDVAREILDAVMASRNGQVAPGQGWERYVVIVCMWVKVKSWKNRGTPHTAHPS